MCIRDRYKAVRSVQTAAGRPPRLFYKPWDHIVRVDGRRVPVRLFAPKTNSRDSILLFFHGGGWVTGNIDSYDRVCANLSNITGRMVVSVDYRLAPEHRFPAAPEDCYAVARDIFTDLSLFMMTPRQITLDVYKRQAKRWHTSARISESPENPLSTTPASAPPLGRESCISSARCCAS